MGQADRSPSRSPIGGRFQIEERPTIHCVARIPTRPHRDLGLAVAIDVGGGHADVILRREVFGDDMLFPLGVPVPGDLLGIAQDDIRAAIPIYVSHGHPVTDGDVGVDVDGSEPRNQRLNRQSRQ